MLIFFLFGIDGLNEHISLDTFTYHTLNMGVSPYSTALSSNQRLSKDLREFAEDTLKTINA